MKLQDGYNFFLTGSIHITLDDIGIPFTSWRHSMAYFQKRKSLVNVYIIYTTILTQSHISFAEPRHVVGQWTVVPRHHSRVLTVLSFDSSMFGGFQR